MDQSDLVERLSHVETTGVLYFTPPFFGTIAGQTDINVKPGSGQVVDAIAGTITTVTWAEQTLPNPYIGTSETTQVFIDINGNMVFEAVGIVSDKSVAEKIYIAVVANSPTAQITYSLACEYAGGLGQTMQQHVRNQGPENVLGEIQITPATGPANVKLKRSPGRMSRKGVNYANLSTDKANDPLAITAADPLTFSHTYKTLTGYVITATGTDLDVSHINNVATGTLDTFTGYQIMRALQVGNQAAIVAYGQNAYPNIDAAIAAIPTDSFDGSGLLKNQLLLAYIVVKTGTTDLTNTANCKIVPANQASGGGGGGGTGDVTGPSSSIAGSISTYADTTGKALQDANPHIGTLHALLQANGIF